MPEVFLDSAYAIASSSPSDQHHIAALELGKKLSSARTGIVTTSAVILEIGNALAKQRYREIAVGVLNRIEADPRITIVPLTEPFYRRAVALYSSRRDKEWGLTDCVSFVVMQERGIRVALTTDAHFEQAGFKALMRP